MNIDIFSENITINMYQSCRLVMQGIYANNPNFKMDEIPEKFSSILSTLEELAYQHNLAYYPKDDTFCSIDRISLFEGSIDLSPYDDQEDIDNSLVEWGESVLTKDAIDMVVPVIEGEHNAKRKMVRGLLFKANLGACLLTELCKYEKKDPGFLSFIGDDDMTKFTASLFFNFAWDSIVNFERVRLQYQDGIKDVWVRPTISATDDGRINIYNVNFIVRNILN